MARTVARTVGLVVAPTLGLVVALTLGLVATGIGSGIAVRHAAAGSWSILTAGGSAVAMLGLVLTGIGVRGLWRGTRRWWRLLALPGTLAALGLLYACVIAAMATVVPPTPLGAGGPHQLGPAAHEVRIETADGAPLAAWYLPSRTGAAVVLRHGSGSTRTATLPQAAVLARHGYGVLMIDARGHGNSGGRGMDLGWFGERDTAAAVDFLLARGDVRDGRVGLVGLSMGGEEAIGAAGADPRVRVVVAEGATARTAADKDAWLPGGVPGAVQRGLDRLTDVAVRSMTPAPRPPTLADAVRRAGRTPFLLITAGTRPDEQRAAEVLRRLAPERVQVWTVAGAEHTAGLRAAPDEWERRVIAALDEALEPATLPAP